MKNLLKNVFRSFKNNKVSIVGLTFLTFLSLGIFCVMSNVSSNIKNTYSYISHEGNLHDAVVSEYYNVGNTAYKYDGYVYIYDNLNNYWTTDDGINYTNVVNTRIYNSKDLFLKQNEQYLPLTLEMKTSFNDIAFLPNTITLVDKLYYRDYSISASEELSTNLYLKFIQSCNNDPNLAEKYKDILNFNITENSQIKLIDDITNNFYNKSENNIWTINTNASISNPITILPEYNPQTIDRNGIITDLNFKISKMTDVILKEHYSPMQTYISDTYKNDLTFEQFNSLNITADASFYKVINSNPTDTIDKMVLFPDGEKNKGNQLFDYNDWSPYGAEHLITDDAGNLIINSIDQLMNYQIVSPSQLSSQPSIYFKTIQNRFKYIASGGNFSDQEIQKNINILAGKQLNLDDYQRQIKDNSSDLYKAYSYYYNKCYSNGKEQIIINANGQITFHWINIAIQTCNINNWSTSLSVVNPEYLSANDKYVISPDVFINYNDFSTWFINTYGKNPTTEDVNKDVIKTWFNLLNNDEFNTWFKTIDDKYKIDVGGYKMIIWGCGITPDFIYPIVDFSRPTPNPKKEALVYVNKQGYENIKLGFANSPSEDYLTIDFNSNNQSVQQAILDDINEFAANNMTLPVGMKAAYMAFDKSNVLNASSYRIAYIPNLINTIDIITWVLCSFIILLAIIICTIVIRRNIENNRINIGIMMANGINKWKISFSLLPFALIPSVIGGFFAYILGLFCQIPTLQIFSTYWMLPTTTIGFSLSAFLFALFLPFLIFGFITIIFAFVSLRTNPVKLMKEGSEFKTNKFSNIIKFPFASFGIMTRFRVSLAFNSLWKLFILTLMSMLTTSALVFGFASYGKLDQSKAKNNSVYNYSYAIQLATPTSAGGPYKEFDYNTEYGLNNNDKTQFNYYWGDGSLYDNFVKPYYNISDQTYKEAFEKDNYYYSSIFCPLFNDVVGQKSDIIYQKNKFSSKLTLDYVMGLLGIYSNPWDIAMALMPQNNINLSNEAYENVVNYIGQQVYNAKIGQPYFLDDTKGNNLFLSFIDQIKVDSIITYKINANAAKSLQLDPNFIKLLITAYTDPTVLAIEYPMLYATIPLYVAKNDDNKKSDETYTYIDATSTKINNVSIKESDTKIFGIKNDSDYINLYNNSNAKINNLLFLQDNLFDSSKPIPIIPNAFSAHKHGLKKNDLITFNINNTANKYIDQIKNIKAPSVTFKVVDISQGTQGEEYYISQYNANNILGLSDGKNWNEINDYYMWYEATDKNKYQVYNTATQEKWPNLSEDYNYNLPPVPVIDGPTTKDVPIGFNGVFTQQDNGGPILNSLSLYSYSGLYLSTSMYDTQATKDILAEQNNLALCNYLTGINDLEIYNSASNYYKDQSSDNLKVFEDAIDSMVSKLQQCYGKTTLYTSMTSAIDLEAMNNVYNNLTNTMNMAEMVILLIIIPMSIIIVLMLSSLIINDSKKMAAMLKSLGYSDKQNVISFLSIYLPVIILGLILSIPLSIGLCAAYQTIILAAANILVEINVVWWQYILSVFGIITILSFSCASMAITLRKNRLVDMIK